MTVPDGSISFQFVTRKYGDRFEAWAVVEDRVHVFPRKLWFDELIDAAREGWTSFLVNLVKIGDDGMGQAIVAGDVEPELVARIESSWP